FEEMRRKGVQMSIVVNEYGGVAGLVTLKGLLEELVGSVGEEGETPEEEFEAIDKDTFQVDGGMSIEEANDELELGLPAGDYDTVAGFALQALRRIPQVGDHFHYGNLRFEVTEMSNLKIGRLKIVRRAGRQASHGLTEVFNQPHRDDERPTGDGYQGG
ncbi:MAG: hypothetical protein FJ317_08645, partial [SAR202 cluster bacterium]|nr:hypothetical protein [SAR202 cluster bacterium]